MDIMVAREVAENYAVEIVVYVISLRFDQVLKYRWAVIMQK
jgi:hypothetical protein